MRVLASADIHGKGTVYEWLLRTASERHVEAILLAGDLLGCLDGFATPEAAQQCEARLLAERLSQAACPVLFIMGNDDLVELPADSERVQSLHGRRVKVGPYSFVGYQYSLPFMGGTFEKPEDGIASDLEGLETLLDIETVFVSHSPALGVLDQVWARHKSVASPSGASWNGIRFWLTFTATAIKGSGDRAGISMWPPAGSNAPWFLIWRRWNMRLCGRNMNAPRANKRVKPTAESTCGRIPASGRRGLRAGR